MSQYNNMINVEVVYLECNTSEYTPYITFGMVYPVLEYDTNNFIVISNDRIYRVFLKTAFTLDYDYTIEDTIIINSKVEFVDILDECLSIYKKKNSDYGSSTTKTYKQFGDISYATRINDKINRINSLLTGNKQQVQDESIDDTIMDLINYGILWMVDRRNSR